jgi:BON domain
MMKDKSRLLAVAAMLAAVVALSACNKSPARTDVQVAAEVQGKISQDSRIGSHEIGVQTNNGVVTLSGDVDSEVERTSAASDAATVHGVKTVVNNLVVQQSEALQPSVNNLPPAQTKKKSANGRTAGHDLDTDYGPGAVKSSDSGSGGPSTQPASTPAPAVAQAPPPPPAPPKKVIVPAGTQLTVRLNDALDTERNQVGDSFHATLGAPIMINDEMVIPSGADVVGHVVDVKSAGRFAGNSALTLELTSLSVNGKTYNIQTNQWSRQGKGEGKNTAVKAGGGAAVGAIIGGLAGGGKGAGIGSVAGAGAGTGVAATKKGEQIKLAPEATLSFLLINTVTVTEQASNNRNAGRTPLQQ